MIIYVIRSKRTGWFFRWVEYCDDGYGKYEDVVSNVTPDDLPSFLTKYQKDHFNEYQLNHHKLEDVEFIKFELNEIKEK